MQPVLASQRLDVVPAEVDILDWPVHAEVTVEDVQAAVREQIVCDHERLDLPRLIEEVQQNGQVVIGETYLHELHNFELFVPTEHLQVAEELKVLSAVGNEFKERSALKGTFKSLVDRLLHNALWVRLVYSRRLSFEDLQDLRLSLIALFAFFR